MVYMAQGNVLARHLYEVLGWKFIGRTGRRREKWPPQIEKAEKKSCHVPKLLRQGNGVKNVNVRGLEEKNAQKETPREGKGWFDVGGTWFEGYPCTNLHETAT